MKIKEKINLDLEGLEREGAITIVVFGDSVTHGALAEDEINYETVYWNRLRKKILEVRNYVPVNVINSGIGGVTAKNSVKRVDAQVISHNPDLIIVCFGLNDVNASLEEYLSALQTIFEKCTKSCDDVIFMTPNMFNTYVAEDTLEKHLEYAAITAEYQNGGKMDLYMNSAVELAEKMNVRVCDCYSKWKKLSEIEDVTKLLINRINHPVPEMHELFADSLFEMILGDRDCEKKEISSTMYQG